jgi:hypothetical protein
MKQRLYLNQALTEEKRLKYKIFFACLLAHLAIPLCFIEVPLWMWNVLYVLGGMRQIG